MLSLLDGRSQVPREALQSSVSIASCKGLAGMG